MRVIDAQSLERNPLTRKSAGGMRMVRIALGLLAGVVTGGLVVGAVEYLGMTMFPAPEGLDFSTPEAARASMARIPPAAVASTAAAWGLGALIGGFVAARIAQRAWAAWLIAALLVAASMYNLVAIPSPIGLWASGLGAIVVLGWLAGRIGAPRAA
jgi:hypothetical protein